MISSQLGRALLSTAVAAEDAVTMKPDVDGGYGELVDVLDHIIAEAMAPPAAS